ncbi:MAG: hypothetical protein IKR73_05505 [Oscillospiraceae bacterium]|nr:hypothetical protein [Oscillospiraceae bacterium]
MSRMNMELKARKERSHMIIRVLIFVFLMIFSYILMLTVSSTAALPSMLIPCAICFAMREQPMAAAVYGMVCGLFLDSAYNMLPGLSAVILMWTSMMCSLLVNNVLRKNIFNFICMDAVACFLHGGLHYVLYYYVWGYDPDKQILFRIFLPEFIVSNIAGIVLYILTGIITRRFGAVSEHYIEERNS